MKRRHHLLIVICILIVMISGVFTAEKLTRSEPTPEAKQPPLALARSAKFDGAIASTNVVPPQITATELFDRESPAVVQIEAMNERGDVITLGTGFFISADGLIVTNAHVINEAFNVKVRQNNGASFDNVFHGAIDPFIDLALLKVEGKGLPTLKFNGSEATPVVGSRVYAIGNPQGLVNTLSEGLVSGVREEPSRILIQTTAATWIRLRTRMFISTN